jgi:hypothetical protein
MPVLSCFILALPFPGFEHIWRFGRFDAVLSERERRRLLDFYESCLKRHLYAHGGKRLLSKNGAFAPLALSLAERFPDARFIVALRDPLETVPSQLSSIGDGLAFFGVPADSAPVRERLIAQLTFYYENLEQLQQRLPAERHAVIGMAELRGHLGATLTAIYARFGLVVDADFAAVLTVEDRQSRQYRSAHRYDLAQFGLTPETIAERFAAAYRQPALADGRIADAAPPGAGGNVAEPEPEPGRGSGTAERHRHAAPIEPNSEAA